MDWKRLRGKERWQTCPLRTGQFTVIIQSLAVEAFHKIQHCQYFCTNEVITSEFQNEPNYLFTVPFSDVAIFELKDSVKANDRSIHPICLPEPNYVFKPDVKIFGYGSTGLYRIIGTRQADSVVDHHSITKSTSPALSINSCRIP